MKAKGHPFFSRVDEMLERRGLYRKEIAEIMGCTDKNISNMFARGSLPNIDRCKALAEFLKCSPMWLAWNVGHWDKITDSDTDLINAVKAVPEAPRPLMIELAAYLSKIPAAVKIEKPKQSGGLPNRQSLLERAIDSLQLIQASMSPRDPLALLAESQELALWRQYENLKKPPPEPVLRMPEGDESDSSTVELVRDPVSTTRQLELVHSSHRPPKT